MNTCICFDLTIFFLNHDRKNRYYKDEEFIKKLAQRNSDLRIAHNQPPQKYLIDRIHLAINSYETENELPTLMSIL